MDIICRLCGEPWDAYHLRHDMSWWECVEHRQSTVRNESGTFYHRAEHPIYGRDDCTSEQEVQIEPADNGAVPAEVRAECGLLEPKPGWLNFVARGRGCPSCHGQPELQTRTDVPGFAELDDIEVATEGELSGELF